jgi:DNA polymerase
LNLLFVDFETFYSTKDKFDLKSMSMCEYIRDKRFKVLGMGYMEDLEADWLNPEELEYFVENSVDWSDTILISHNVKFEGAILKWVYNVSPALYMDTVALARAVLGPTINNYSLKRLAEYLGLEAKGELKTDGLATLSLQQEKELSEYCLRDVRICAAIYNKLNPQFPEGQRKSLDWTCRAFIEPKLVLDSEILSKAVEDEKARREEAIKATDYTKEELASSVKFAELVLKAGGTVPVKISKRTGRSISAFSKTDEGLRELEKSFPELVRGRLAAKSTILETRAAKLSSIATTGPWPFDVQYSGAVQTHRYSGGSGAGGNPQNFPRVGPLRGAVQCLPGSSIVVGDFAQIEARIIAWLAQEPKLMAAFSEERDVYSEFASRIYGRTVTKQNDEMERRFGKEAILGLGYGMGFTKFKDRVKAATGMEITDEEARRVVGLYRETYFNVPRLWQRAETLFPAMVDGQTNRVPFGLFLTVRKNSIVLPSGLVLQYPNLRVTGRQFNKPEWGYDRYIKRYDSEVAKIYGGKLIENICQALAGEICKIAIGRCEESGIEVKGQVHDELLCICSNGREQQTCELVSKAMEAPISWMPTLKLKAEVKYGQNWQTAKN